jgi:hypothetical protein
MTANNMGMRIGGLTGRGRPGSRKRKIIAPSTVRKKKAYSARPFRVSKMRIFPSKMYIVESTVFKMSALLAMVSRMFNWEGEILTLAILRHP